IRWRCKMRHSYTSTPPPLPAVLAEMKASPAGGPGLRARQKGRARRWPGLARCFHRSPDRCQAGGRPAGDMDHVCTCESVLQPRHESYYFHVKVVLVAQNSCTESAKRTYIFKNAGDFLRRKRRSYALSDTCFSVTGTDHPCPASYGLVSDSRWIFANNLAQDGIKPHETRMNVARAVETPCG